MINDMVLPKILDENGQSKAIIEFLGSKMEKLWAKSEFSVPFVPFNDEFVEVLLAAAEQDRLNGGFESIERKLGFETRGLNQVDKNTSIARGERVSRLLLLTNDGAERFYRKVEKLMRKTGSRLLVIVVDVDSLRLGEILYGPDKFVKSVLIEHKESVSAALMALCQ